MQAQIFKALVLLLMVSLWTSTDVLAQDTYKLTIKVTNIKNTSGKPILVGLYGANDNFPEDSPNVKGKSAKATSGTVSITFDVPKGKYAAAIYHDINSNNKLDTDMFGIPKEPYGFSQNFRPKMSAPDFEDCEVNVTKDTTISVKLID